MVDCRFDLGLMLTCYELDPSENCARK